MSQNENKEKSSDAENQQIPAFEDDLKETPVQDPPPSNQNEQDVYNRVLEKLAVEENSGQVQEKSAQAEAQSPEIDSVQAQTKAMIEVTLKQDFLKIESLAKLGIINSLQKQNLKNIVLKKAFDMIVQNEKMRRLSPAPLSGPQGKDEAFREFDKENPDFFTSDGRKEVLDYLKSESVSVDKDDLQKISQMVENIEKNAIDRYLKQSAYEKNLLDSNELAKQKLTANAQNSSFQDKNLTRTFTREQIGKMSGAEFVKYEPLIMEQLRKGLIR